ncbi:MAG: glutamine synthetase [marine bacterium B5-7]|nr:MAG: glutamine synthetase [marine bacterium B5-7]
MAAGSNSTDIGFDLSNFTHVDALLPDINGVLRGKRLAIEEFTKLIENGVQLPGTIFTTDITGATVDLEDIGLLIGDPDMLCLHSPATICPVPWDEGVAQVMLSMYTLDGEPFFADPRHVLQRILKRFKDDGLSPVLAMEVEFYLTDYDGKALKPELPHSPLSGEQEWSVQVYGMTELWDFSEFLGDVEHFCKVQGVPASAASSEYAPGQFEINLDHTDDVISACEHVLMLKNIIRQAANLHGMCATFMAKPFEERAGNGCHVHVSVLDNHGNNIFSDDDPTGSDSLKHAIAGLINTMADCTAIFAPGANSYRRLVRGAYAPVHLSWDDNNRTVALRIPASDPVARRVEHRVAGADVNPWLFVSAVLGGIHQGLTLKSEPPKKIEGNAYKQSLPGIPDNWKEALERFSESAFIDDYFGREFATVYARIKNHEREIFERAITTLEYQWYMRRI